jgi:hypothetical protein
MLAAIDLAAYVSRMVLGISRRRPYTDDATVARPQWTE